MKLSRRIPAVALGAGLLIAAGVAVPEGHLVAQERPAVDVNKLVNELVDDSFDVRRAAKEKLVRLGKLAVPALTAAAQDATNDTNYSAVRVLTRMARDLDGENANAAKTALQKIAKGNDIIARQARESLEEMQQAERRPQRGGVRNFGIPGGRVDIIGGGNGNFRSSQTSIVNGVVNTKVTEQGRTVEIKRDPQGSVSVTLTEDGKKPQTWKADSLAELKTKHPKGHELLQKYSGNTRRMMIPRGGGLGINIDDLMEDMMGAPMQFGAVDPFEQLDRLDPFRRRRRPAPQVSKEIKDAKLLTRDLADLVSSMKKKSASPELQRMQDKLEALQRSLDRIEKQAGR